MKTQQPEDNIASSQESEQSVVQSCQKLQTQNGLAVASMVTGIVSVIFCFIAGLGLIMGSAALIMGIFGLKKVNGKGMAITGIATGGIALLINLIIIIVWVMIITMFRSMHPYYYY